MTSYGPPFPPSPSSPISSECRECPTATENFERDNAQPRLAFSHYPPRGTGQPNVENRPQSSGVNLYTGVASHSYPVLSTAASKPRLIPCNADVSGLLFLVVVSPHASTFSAASAPWKHAFSCIGRCEGWPPPPASGPPSGCRWHSCIITKTKKMRVDRLRISLEVSVLLNFATIAKNSAIDRHSQDCL
jgi:hypothetical protein